MPITDTARKNHEKRFPNHASTLATTDRELVDILDSFAFDKVRGAAIRCHTVSRRAGTGGPESRDQRRPSLEAALPAPPYLGIASRSELVPRVGSFT